MPSRMFLGQDWMFQRLVTVMGSGFQDTKAPSIAHACTQQRGFYTVVLTSQMKWRPQDECWQPPKVN